MSTAAPSAAKVCGFSFGRNLTRLDYPVEAAVRSVLPVCDRFVFAVGRSDDDTRQRIERIDTGVMAGGRGGTIDIVDTDWPDVNVDGQVLAIEANKAMAAAEAIAGEDGCTWGFYIQADEVIHEDDLPKVRAAMDGYAEDPQVKALLFRYLHFVLDYQTTDPWMYHKAARVVRLDGSCTIFGDACGPGLKDPPPDVLKINDGYLDKKHLGSHVRWAADPAIERKRAAAGWWPWAGWRARVFHYGWVKSRDQLDAKLDTVRKLWWGTLDRGEAQRREETKFGDFIDRYPALKKYHGSHPAEMLGRVAAHEPFARVPTRWLHPRFWRESLSHGFHG